MEMEKFGCKSYRNGTAHNCTDSKLDQFYHAFFLVI
jgi:hypothetical protein